MPNMNSICQTYPGVSVSSNLPTDRRSDGQTDRQTHGLRDETDYDIPDNTKRTQTRVHNLSKFHQMTHIKSKFENRSIICAVQYTSASSKHMKIVSTLQRRNCVI